jgi:hypothetical protein
LTIFAYQVNSPHPLSGFLTSHVLVRESCNPNLSSLVLQLGFPEAFVWHGGCSHFPLDIPFDLTLDPVKKGNFPLDFFSI